MDVPSRKNSASFVSFAFARYLAGDNEFGSLFLAQYDRNGTFQWVFTTNGTGTSLISGSAVQFGSTDKRHYTRNITN